MTHKRHYQASHAGHVEEDWFLCRIQVHFTLYDGSGINVTFHTAAQENRGNSDIRLTGPGLPGGPMV